MCLVRLLMFLNLEKVTQVSFAEYHSKRNYVERVHAEENRVLSKHGPFKCDCIHKNVITGSDQHRENMEEMATEVTHCLRRASFGGNLYTVTEVLRMPISYLMMKIHYTHF